MKKVFAHMDELLEVMHSHKTLNNKLEKISNEMKEIESTLNRIISVTTDNVVLVRDRDHFFDLVLSACSIMHSIPEDDILSKSRDENFVAARHTCAWLMTQKVEWSLFAIANQFKRRGKSFDHSMVIYARNRVDEWINMRKRTKVRDGKTNDWGKKAQYLDLIIPKYDFAAGFPIIVDHGN